MEPIGPAGPHCLMALPDVQVWESGPYYGRLLLSGGKLRLLRRPFHPDVEILCTKGESDLTFNLVPNFSWKHMRQNQTAEPDKPGPIDWANCTVRHAISIEHELISSQR
jgi:hypothetical protein